MELLVNDDIDRDNRNTNMLNISIPYVFAASLVKLTWHDLFYGINHQYFSIESAIDHAFSRVIEDEEPSFEIIELAQLKRPEPAYPLLLDIIQLEQPVILQQIEDKLLYIVLEWVYQNQSNYSDPLEVVECIYADFNYPESMRNFVRFMPMTEPNLGSRELNIKRLYNNWKLYLDNQRIVYSTI